MARQTHHARGPGGAKVRRRVRDMTLRVARYHLAAEASLRVAVSRIVHVGLVV